MVQAGPQAMDARRSRRRARSESDSEGTLVNRNRFWLNSESMVVLDRGSCRFEGSPAHPAPVWSRIMFDTRVATIHRDEESDSTCRKGSGHNSWLAVVVRCFRNAHGKRPQMCYG